MRLKAHVATVHEERSVSAQPLGRQVEQVRLGNHSVVQVERPLQTRRRWRNCVIYTQNHDLKKKKKAQSWAKQFVAPCRTCCPADTSQDEPSASAAAAAESWTRTWQRSARPAVCSFRSARLSGKQTQSLFKVCVSFILNSVLWIFLCFFCYFYFLIFFHY